LLFSSNNPKNFLLDDDVIWNDVHGNTQLQTTSGSMWKSFSGPTTKAFVDPSFILGIILVVFAAASYS
jgi:hypothetical protein